MIPPTNTTTNRGTCQKTISLQTVSYIVSAIQMVTDWVCAGVPFVIVAGLQMSRRKKVSVICILGLGVFASVATCVRMPYLKYYDTTTYPTDIACEFIRSPIEEISADEHGTPQIILESSTSPRTSSAASA